MKHMVVYLTLAWRNIWRNRRRTLITAFALVFAVVASVFMQSLNRGSHEQMLDHMIRFSTGYVRLQDYRFEAEPSLDNTFPYDGAMRSRVLATDAGIVSVVPRIEAFMLAANDQSTRGSLVFGIELEDEQAFNGFRDRLSAGRFFDDGERAVVLAEGLAERLRLSVGDTVALLGQGRFGMSASGLFEIVGLVSHPLRELNNQGVFLSLSAAQELLSAEGYVSALLIAPERERHTASLAAALEAAFADDDLAVFAWPELLPELLELFELDLAAPRFLTLVLYIVIGFGFFGTVLTMTMERLREFGMMLAMGMKRSRLAIVILLENLFIGLLGVGAGLMASWLLLAYFHLRPITLTGDAAQAVMDMGWEPVLPMSFAADQFYTQGLFVFAIALLAFLFPLAKILRLNIMEATRG